MTTAKGKRTRQVNLKLDADLYARLNKACEIQQHRDGQLARILVEWALPFYEGARSIEALSATVLSSRLTRKRQESLVKALRAILDRAPVTEIENIVRYLARRARNYAGER